MAFMWYRPMAYAAPCQMFLFSPYVYENMGQSADSIFIDNRDLKTLFGSI